MTDVLANRSAEDRSGTDFYPTPPNVTHALMKFLALEPDTRVWECACGAGMMSEVLKEYVSDVVSTDLYDMGYGEYGRDFRAEKKLLAPVIITNPPFKYSEDFIRHALSLKADVVAFLLKSQYWHAERRVKLFYEFPPAWVLPLTWRPDFLFGAKSASPTMDVLWTVWIRGEHDTRYRVLSKPKG